MSRYDGLIIPRSYSEYINKTDAATLQQALQLGGVLAQQVSAGNNAAVTSNAVNGALTEYVQGRRVLFTKGMDLNTVITAGEYYANTDALGNSLLNRPSFSSGNLYGCSMSVYSSTNGGVVQILHTVNGNYSRWTDNNGTTWGNWSKLSTEQDVNNIKWQIGAIWTSVNTDVCDASNLYNIKIQQGDVTMYQLTGWIRVKSGTYAAKTKVFELPHNALINTYLFGAASGIVKPDFYQLYVDGSSKDVFFMRDVHFETFTYIQFNTFICTRGA